MAVRGRSVTGGRPPKWLDAATDIRLLGVSGDRDTQFRFEVPRLGEAAHELYDQPEFWSEKPDPESTGLDLLAEVVSEIDRGNEESDRFDSHLLRRVSRFGRAVSAGFDEIVLDRSGGVHGAISQRTIDMAESLRVETPPSRQVRIAGVLDMLRVSTQTLALRLDGGEEIRGVLSESVRPLTGLLDQRVVVFGRAVYRPSGRLLRIDVDAVETGEGASAFWSRVPKPSGVTRRPGELRRPQTTRTGVAAFFGTWPGEETDAELLAALRALG